MDLQNLKDKYPLLISYMEAENYSKPYIRSIEKDIGWILKESGHYKWDTYDNIYRTYMDEWKNKTTLKHKRRRLSLI